MFELPAAIAAYCAILIAAFVGLWLYYDRRDHAAFERERRKTTFACIRCEKLYAGPAGADLQKCPHCGHENVRLSF